MVIEPPPVSDRGGLWPGELTCTCKGPEPLFSTVILPLEVAFGRADKLNDFLFTWIRPPPGVGVAVGVDVLVAVAVAVAVAVRVGVAVGVGVAPVGTFNDTVSIAKSLQSPVQLVMLNSTLVMLAAVLSRTPIKVASPLTSLVAGNDPSEVPPLNASIFAVN